jgi:hypothetical protein
MLRQPKIRSVNVWKARPAIIMSLAVEIGLKSAAARPPPTPVLCQKLEACSFCKPYIPCIAMLKISHAIKIHVYRWGLRREISDLKTMMRCLRFRYSPAARNAGASVSPTICNLKVPSPKGLLCKAIRPP